MCWCVLLLFGGRIANPFSPVSPVPLDGPGPNPLLQNHILMVIHPPALYLGYVGMAVPFAMGAAALFAGKIGSCLECRTSEMDAVTLGMFDHWYSFGRMVEL